MYWILQKIVVNNLVEKWVVVERIDTADFSELPSNSNHFYGHHLYFHPVFSVRPSKKGGQCTHRSVCT